MKFLSRHFKQVICLGQHSIMCFSTSEFKKEIKISSIVAVSIYINLHLHADQVSFAFSSTHWSQAQMADILQRTHSNLPSKRRMWFKFHCYMFAMLHTRNKANLRDLIAATGLAILLKLDWNCQFFSLCDLEIWWMTSKNYRAPLLHYIKLCVSSQTPPWIQTGVTVRKHTIRVKIGDFFVLCDIEIWRMTLKNNRASLLCYIKLCASSNPLVNSKSNYSPEMLNLGQNRRLF